MFHQSPLFIIVELSFKISHTPDIDKGLWFEGFVKVLLDSEFVHKSYDALIVQNMYIESWVFICDQVFTFVLSTMFHLPPSFTSIKLTQYFTILSGRSTSRFSSYCCAI